MAVGGYEILYELMLRVSLAMVRSEMWAIRSGRVYFSLACFIFLHHEIPFVTFALVDVNITMMYLLK